MANEERLWAPWRLEYLQKEVRNNSSTSRKECVFCSARKKGPTLESLILFQDKDIFVILNKFPYNPYHLMVLPLLHTGDPTKLPTKIWNKLNEATRQCLLILKKTIKPHGYNIGMNVGEAGGAGIAQHLHMHVLPRWKGDTNFMPILAETKAIPTHIETIYKNLVPKFKNFADKL